MNSIYFTKSKENWVFEKKEHFFFGDDYKQNVCFSIGGTFYLVKLLTWLNKLTWLNSKFEFNLVKNWI